MNIAKIPAGKNPPHEVNVIIENPRGDGPVKYAFDKNSGTMYVSRFLHTAMFYPADYGFIPNTVLEGTNPLGCLVLGRHVLIPGCVLPSRPIGALLMEDERGLGQKIIAVPVTRLHPFFEDVASLDSLHTVQIKKIEHFFTHYKDLEDDKFARVTRWVGPEEAGEIIVNAIARHDAQSRGPGQTELFGDLAISASREA